MKEGGQSLAWAEAKPAGGAKYATVSTNEVRGKRWVKVHLKSFGKATPASMDRARCWAALFNARGFLQEAMRHA